MKMAPDESKRTGESKHELSIPFQKYNFEFRLNELLIKNAGIL